jgi:anhydro-N-acetylmuramic acid kinase
MAQSLMNWVGKLAQIAKKPSRRIIGLMSGTSLDGLDVALCRIAGSGRYSKLVVEQSKTFAYTEEAKLAIKKVFAKDVINLQELCLLNEEIGNLHGKWVNAALQAWGLNAEDIDLIASHGQTIFHAPQSFHGDAKRPNGTLQIGDGDHIAALTGIITVSDFRQRHVAHGGEGAPLVIYGDQLLFSSESATRVLVNLGGICNLTLLPKHSEHNAIATDVGPANTLLDTYCQVFCNQSYDQDGLMAKQGTVHTGFLDALLDHPFFTETMPKTTGPELFNLAYIESAKRQAGATSIGHFDTLATLVLFSAKALAREIKTLSDDYRIDEIYLSGGGVCNPALRSAIVHELSAYSVSDIDALGVSAGEKEAALFAILANECVAGSSKEYRLSKHSPAVSMGKICFPN